MNRANEAETQESLHPEIALLFGENSTRGATFRMLKRLSDLYRVFVGMERNESLLDREVDWKDFAAKHEVTTETVIKDLHKLADKKLLQKRLNYRTETNKGVFEFAIELSGNPSVLATCPDCGAYIFDRIIKVTRM